MKNRIRLQTPALIALAIATLGGAPALAQTDSVEPTTATPSPPQPVYPANPDADLLQSEMRFLAANPRDLRALLSAAQISNRLGDTSAAMAFYARAEKVEPDNPRIMAGRAQVLVQLERPAEALRMFQAAEQRGVPMNDYLADRGLAYDLLGQPVFAQRDYRASLQYKREDETTRRLALSLGIAGKYDDAMRELDGLLRRSDRAAWRARAFILAMQGDFEGADRIAQSMMPGNMGAALAPFFRRLPNLAPADKAFAVHFGQLSPTAARRADAQYAPDLPPFVPERAPPPVQVAAVTPAPSPAVVPIQRDRRGRQRPTQLAAVTSASSRPVVPVPQPQSNPLPPPPQYVAPTVQPLPMAPAATAPTPTPAPRPTGVRVASTSSDQLQTARRVPGQRSGTPLARGDGDVPISAAPGRAKPGEDNGVLDGIVEGITIPDAERAALEIPADSAPAPVTTRPAGKPAVAPPTTRTAATKPAATPPARRAEPKPPPEPKRYWVQVGIGQNEKLLPQTWRKLVKDNPAVFRGRSPWWTPLRATNRLLVGPFKSADEAQAFVNTLRKADVDGVAFTSEAGQKVTKLEVK